MSCSENPFPKDHLLADTPEYYCECSDEEYERRQAEEDDAWDDHDTDLDDEWGSQNDEGPDPSQGD